MKYCWLCGEALESKPDFLLDGNGQIAFDLCINVYCSRYGLVTMYHILSLDRAQKLRKKFAKKKR